MAKRKFDHIERIRASIGQRKKVLIILLWQNCPLGKERWSTIWQRKRVLHKAKEENLLSHLQGKVLGLKVTEQDDAPGHIYKAKYSDIK
jgi:hypothetical protein